MSTPTALRLSLTIQMQMYERQARMDAAITDVVLKQTEQEKRMCSFPTKQELEEVRRHSIIEWIEKHPKAFLAGIVGYVVLAPRLDLFLFVQDILKALGIMH